MSFIAALQRLGGMAIDVPINDSGSYRLEYKQGIVMDGATIENVKDAAKVLSLYCDFIGVRASTLVTNREKSENSGSWVDMKSDTVINSFIQYATVPVINMESNVYHPCQGLADAMTIVEKMGQSASSHPSNKHNTIKYVLTWVPHPKALPMATPNSQLISACELGLDVTLVHPSGWEIDPDILKIAKRKIKEANGSISILNNQTNALHDADIVCAKSWGAMSLYQDLEKEKKFKANYGNWIIDNEKLKLTNNAYFMHCLPVRRNVEVTDEVLDSERSLIYSQAENRMWIQMAILLSL